MIKTYRQLMRFRTFEERYEYLRIGGRVGEDTMGFDRWLSQAFYHSREWRAIRKDVILRDEACDLGIAGHDIFYRPLVHHINPITIEDIEAGNPCVFDLNNLILTTHDTHNAIHYGDASLLVRLPMERREGDTLLWQPRQRAAY